MNEDWSWKGTWLDTRAEREQFDAGIHQRYIDENPDFIPGCWCHPMTREARLALKELKESEMSTEHAWQEVTRSDGRQVRRCARCLYDYEFGKDFPCPVKETK